MASTARPRSSNHRRSCAQGAACLELPYHMPAGVCVSWQSCPSQQPTSMSKGTLNMEAKQSLNSTPFPSCPIQGSCFKHNDL